MNYIRGGLKKPSRQRQTDAQIIGFKTGVLAMAATMNDLFGDEVTEDMIAATVKGAMEVMYAIADGSENCRYINSELAKRTGIDILNAEEKR